MKLTRRFHPWTTFSIIILVLGAWWTWASAAPPGGTTTGRIPAPRPGFQAPEFSLQALDGSTVTLAGLRGRPILVNLWASWCLPCRAEMPAMQRLYTDLQDTGFLILAVNATSQDNLPAVEAFVTELGLSFPVLLDTGGQVSAAYELRSLPTSFFIDSQGTIREVIIGGPMSEALLRIRAGQLLEEDD
jgi:peroxiredoxin